MMRISLPCSEANLAYLCPASIVDEGVRYSEPAGDEAELGKVVHDAIANLAQGKEYNLEEVCQSKGMSSMECKRLIDVGLEYLQRLEYDSSSFDIRSFEQFMECADCVFYGFADLVLVNNKSRSGIVVDWKTGYTPVDKHQVLAYAYLASHKYDVDTVECHLVYLRKMYADVFHHSKKQIEDWYDDWCRRVFTRGGDYRETYNPGQHCCYCKRLLNCPGVAGVMKAFSGAVGIDGEDLVALYGKAVTMEKTAARIKEIIKSLVMTNGGEYVSSSGGLKVSSRTYKDIHLGHGYTVLGAYIDTTDILDKISISQSKLESILRDAGMNREEIEQVMNELEQSGAVTERTYKYLDLVNTNTEDSK